MVTDYLEGSHNETEAKDFSIVNVSFKIIDIREAHHNKIILNTAIIINPIFREIKQIATEADNDSLYLYVNNDIEYGLFEDIVDSYYLDSQIRDDFQCNHDCYYNTET